MRNNVIVLASDLAGGLGNNGGLPWPHCPEDLRAFREATRGATCLMGSTTFRSMKGVNWAERNPVVVSRTDIPGVKTIPPADVGEFLDSPESIFIIGGSSLYNCEEVWDFAETVLYTLHSNVYECDTYLHKNALYIMENEFKRTGAQILKEGVTLICRKRTAE